MPELVRVFISYAREDESVARRLYVDLRVHGVRPWLDLEDLVAGEDWRGKIEESLRASTFCVVLLSSRALSKKGYYQKELRTALEIVEMLPYGSIFLIPARLDECEPRDALLQRLHRVDLFPSYAAGLQRILRAIRRVTGPVAVDEDLSSASACRVCGYPAPQHVTSCPACGADLGPPNVRAAIEQRASLDLRYREAWQRADVEGYSDDLREVERLAAASSIAFAMSSESLLGLLADRSDVFAPFHRVWGDEQGSRSLVGLSADNILFPYFHQTLLFGVLAIDGSCSRRHGRCLVVPHDRFIAQRATVLEDNSFQLAQNGLLGEGPNGVLATWSDRQRLAVARLTSRLEQAAAAVPHDPQPRPTPLSVVQSMEAQLFGGLMRQAIASIYLSPKSDRANEDVFIFDAIQRQAEKFGIVCSVSSSTSPEG